MAKAVDLQADARTERGRSAVRKLRNKGMLPGVIYGPGIETLSLTLPRADLIRTLNAHGLHPLVNIHVNGDEYLAIVQEVQVDPVRWEAVHVDFRRVEENKPVQTEVGVELTGTPAGVKEGGVLEVQMRALAIEALPRSLPDSVTFDVSELGVGDVARVGDIMPPEGVTILTDPEETLCSVAVPRLEEEAPALTPEEAEALAALTDEEREALAALADAVEEEAPAEEAG
jgi:large subunit ribosomal protein L25